MRSAFPPIVAILFLALLVPMPAAAAETTTTTTSLTDPTGDVNAGAWGGPVGTGLPASAPAGTLDHVDIVGLDIVETGEDLTFTFRVVDLSRPNPWVNYAVRFDWNDVTYQATVGHVSLSGFSNAWLNSIKGNSWEFVTELPHSVSVGEKTLQVTLPRAYVLDSKDRMPLKGDALGSLHGMSHSTMNMNLAVVSAGNSIYDRIPDGDATISLPFTIGGESVGHLRIYSPEPVRVSNGGATTFVFQVVVENNGTADDDISLTTTNLPEGWRTSVQSPVRVPAGSSRTVPVLASVPFAHDHGGFSAFVVEARSGRDGAAFAAAEMGVLHTPVPQPAGHHPDLYLHTGAGGNGLLDPVFPWRPAYMNTEADHANDEEGILINAFQQGIGWAIDLEPAMRIGLDFDLDRVGTLTGAIKGKRPIETDLYVELYLVQGDDETLLAEAPVQTIMLDATGDTSFTAELVPTKAADYIPYEKDQNLRLRIRIPNANFFCCDAVTTPELMVEPFKLTLPLNEYHDRLAALPTGVGGGVELVPLGDHAKAGRPGSLLTYAFMLRNTGLTEETFVLTTAGTDAAAGELAPAGEVRLAPNEERRVTLGVRVPTAANTGEVVEVLVFARAQTDPAVSAIGRTMTRVTTGEEAVGDESALFAAAQDEAKETPGVGLALVVLSLAGVARLRRK